MKFFNKLQNSILGLDIDDRSLKIVEMAKKTFGKNVKISRMNSIDLPDNIISNGQIVNKKDFIKVLKNLVEKSGFSTKKVAAMLPETKSFVAVLDGTKKDFIDFEYNDNDENIKKLIENAVPFKYEEIYFDVDSIKVNKKEKILFGASKKEIVDSYFESLTEAGLIPIALEPESLAISRSIINHKQNFAYGQIILDFGKTHSTLIIYDNNVIKLSVNVPLSGDLITKKIADSLGITPEKAELEKINCGNNAKSCKIKVNEIVIEAINEIIYKIIVTLDYYRKNFTDCYAIEKLYLVGQGSKYKNIEKIFSEQLPKIQIAKAAPAVNLNITPEFFMKYATAIGLCLKEFPEAYV